MDADQKRRRIVGHAADRGRGESGAARGTVGRDDVDGRAETGHRITVVPGSHILHRCPHPSMAGAKASSRNTWANTDAPAAT